MFIFYSYLNTLKYIIFLKTLSCIQTIRTLLTEPTKCGNQCNAVVYVTRAYIVVGAV